MRKQLAIATIIYLILFFAVTATVVVSCKHHKFSKKYDHKPKYR